MNAWQGCRQLLSSGLVVCCAVALALPTPGIAKQAGGDWSTPGLAQSDDMQQKFYKLENGTQVQQLTEGAGKEAASGDRVLFDYVLRRSNGYFIYSTMEGVSFQPKDIPTGPVAFQIGTAQMIDGLDAALLRQKPGAKLRVLVPPRVGYVDTSAQPAPPGFAAKRQIVNHNREPLLFEVQVLKVLPPPKAT